MKCVLSSLWLRSAVLAFALSVLCSLSACASDAECVDCVCPGGEVLTEDLFDVAGLYTTAGQPVAVLRFDFAGDCLGSGERAYVIYRTSTLEVATAVDIDAFRAPRHVPDSFRYEYDVEAVAIVARRVAANAIDLTFDDGSDTPLTARCEVAAGAITCTAM